MGSGKKTDLWISGQNKLERWCRGCLAGAVFLCFFMSLQNKMHIAALVYLLSNIYDLGVVVPIVRTSFAELSHSNSEFRCRKIGSTRIRISKLILRSDRKSALIEFAYARSSKGEGGVMRNEEIVSWKGGWSITRGRGYISRNLVFFL